MGSSAKGACVYNMPAKSRSLSQAIFLRHHLAPESYRRTLMIQ